MKTYIPLEKREAWTLPQAAAVYGLDPDVLRDEAANENLTTFTQSDSPRAYPRVTRNEIEKWIARRQNYENA